MANMNYCRFENTYHDLQDCYDNWDEGTLSKTEEKFRQRILDLCRDILLENDDDEDEEE